MTLNAVLKLMVVYNTRMYQVVAFVMKNTVQMNILKQCYSNGSVDNDINIVCLHQLCVCSLFTSNPFNAHGSSSVKSKHCTNKDTRPVYVAVASLRGMTFQIGPRSSSLLRYKYCTTIISV